MKNELVPFVFVEPHITNLAFSRGLRRRQHCHGLPHCPWLDVDDGIDSDRGGTLDMDDSCLNVGNNGGIINQLHWALVVVRLGWKESSKVGLQPLKRPIGESTLKKMPHSEIGNVLFGEFLQISFFAGSTVNCLEWMANNIPH